MLGNPGGNRPTVQLINLGSILDIPGVIFRNSGPILGNPEQYRAILDNSVQ